MTLCLTSGLEALGASLLHVTVSGSDAANGRTWATAKRTVGGALAAAAAGDEIWVAQGVYAERIQMKAEVALYGGFAGTEAVRDQRDWGLYPTILDGSKGGIVVRCEVPFATAATRIDGFVIRNGQGILGGGIGCTACDPTIANNVITNNLSSGPGGGICCYNGADATIVNNYIADNTSTGDDADGGGIGVMAGDSPGTSGSSPTIIGNIIVGNRAEENGGGIGVKDSGSAPTILNNFISGNLATQPPLGDRSLGGGGIACVDGAMAKWIANNTITANGGLQAGGILLVGGATDNPPVINNTIVGNSGPALCSAGVNNVKLVNNLIAFNTCGISRSSVVVGGGLTLIGNLVYGNVIDYDGIASATGVNGNLAVDPGLVSALYGDSHLRADSPCVNSGNAAYVQAEWTDMDGRARVRDGQVDIGADEFDGTVRIASPKVVRVLPTGNDNADGATWGTAKRTVAAAIRSITMSYVKPQHLVAGGEVWVAAGTYGENLTVPPYVHLFGGFQGNEATREARNAGANLTRLDGGSKGRTVFAYGGHLLNTLDGFLITGGRIVANFTDQGGGVECYQSGTVVTNCRITGNIGNLGGGVGAFGGGPIITGCTITNNSAASDGNGIGGAIHLDHSLAFVQNCELAYNSASDGGGVYGSASKPRLQRNRIHDNTGNGVKLLNSSSLVWGPLDFPLVGNNAIYYNLTSDSGGGIHIVYCGGRVENNLVVANRSGTLTGGGYGGGMTLVGGQAADGPLLVANNSVLGNTADYFGLNNGGGLNVMVYQTANLILANNIVAYNTSGIINQQASVASPVMIKNDFYSNNGLDYQLTGSYGTPAGPLSHPSDIALDPRFVSLSGDYHLQSTSPCIDSGDATSNSTTDIEGRPRPLDGNNDGTSLPDLGAYEYGHPSARGRLELAAPAFYSHVSSGRLEFEVRRLSGVAGAVSVSYSLSNGTAVAGTHFQLANGVLSLADGQSSAKGSVNLLTGTKTTNLLNFRVTLSNPTGGATLGPRTTATNYLAFPSSSSSNPWGIPDSWVLSNGLTLTATSDADRDGLLDRFEYFAGTGPTNSTSTFQLRLTPLGPGGGLKVGWSSVPGKRYTLRRSSSLTANPPFATALKTNLLADSIVTTFIDVGGGGRAFYQVEVEQ